LQVFILNDQDLKSSISQLKRIFDLRTNVNLDFWLIDISVLKSAAEIQNLKLNYNDDVFLYSIGGNNNSHISIMEGYKISSLINNVTILKYGNWSHTAGLTLFGNKNKWVRRKDLKVFFMFFNKPT
jgi:hypothetical protein